MKWANSIEKESNWKAIVFSLIGENAITKIIEEKKYKWPPNFIHSSPGNPIHLKFFNYLVRFFTKYRVPLGRYIKPILQTFQDVIESKLKIRELQKLLTLHEVSVLMMPDSSPSYSAPLLFAAARKENVSVMTNPLDRDCPESYAMIYKSDPALKADLFMNKVIGKLFPKWLITYDNTRLLRIKAQQIIVQEALGIAPPNPWNTFGFLEDILVVSNKIQKRFFLDTGVDDEKIQVLGSPELDYMSSLLRDLESHSRNVCADLKFSESKPIMLCALPQTHWISGRSEAEFQDHEEMIDTWIRCLTSQTSYNILISLHPSMQYEQYKYLERPDLKIAQIDLVDLLPICSIFVAAISSTIHFAIALGKPVINYDVYRYSEEMDYLRFEEAEGTVTVLNQTDFSKAIGRITSDDNYYNDLKAKQEKIAHQWGVIDGQSMNRFIEFIEGYMRVN